jgi:hypothetical protein
MEEGQEPISIESRFSGDCPELRRHLPVDISRTPNLSIEHVRKTRA